MKDVIHTCLTSNQPRGVSLISCLLDAQTCREERSRSFQYCQNVDCLVWDGEDFVCEPGHVHHHLRKSKVPLVEGCFVAVSYRCDRSLAKGAHHIVEGDQSHTKTQAPDMIIDRAIEYLRHHDASVLWIDKECIKQSANVEKQRMMQVMDLIYRCSKFPLGMLTTSIQKQSHINFLEDLLQDEYVKCGHGTPALSRRAGYWKARKVLSVLSHVMDDPWWSRRWIFQEEYCGSTKMCIMIPHAGKLSKNKIMGTIPGELLIKVAQFRQKVTMFCLACFHADIFTCADDQEKCRRVLRKAKTYSMLRRFGWMMGDESLGRAMSLRILSDIDRRAVEIPTDTLAIMANCCGYNVRLNIDQLHCTVFSLGVAVAAMYLLNGEILWNDERSSSPADILQLLRDLSFNKFHPPSKLRALTFMKKCRFVAVRLDETGVMTLGHIWHIQKRIRLERSCRKIQQTFEHCKRKHLLQLADQLEQTHPSLSQSLRQSADGIVAQHLKSGDLQAVFDEMASAVEEAISAGKSLLVANLVSNPGKWAVFISPRRYIHQPQFVFTAHEGAKYSNIVGRYESPVKYVSMLVSRLSENGRIPQLVTRVWVNGLCFPDGEPMMEVKFPWSATMRRIRILDFDNVI